MYMFFNLDEHQSDNFVTAVSAGASALYAPCTRRYSWWWLRIASSPILGLRERIPSDPEHIVPAPLPVSACACVACTGTYVDPGRGVGWTASFELFFQTTCAFRLRNIKGRNVRILSGCAVMRKNRFEKVCESLLWKFKAKKKLPLSDDRCARLEQKMTALRLV